MHAAIIVQSPANQWSTGTRCPSLQHAAVGKNDMLTARKPSQADLKRAKQLAGDPGPYC